MEFALANLPAWKEYPARELDEVDFPVECFRVKSGYLHHAVHGGLVHQQRKHLTVLVGDSLFLCGGPTDRKDFATGVAAPAGSAGPRDPIANVGIGRVIDGPVTVFTSWVGAGRRWLGVQVADQAVEFFGNACIAAQGQNFLAQAALHGGLSLA